MPYVDFNKQRAHDPHIWTISFIPKHLARISETREMKNRYGLRLARKARLARRGLTEFDYIQMWIDQGGCCKICDEPSRHNHDFHVDHNHKTGEIRGLLCHSCNLMIGQAGDNPALLQAGIDYLAAEAVR